jgi:hypothetical protein
MAILLILKIMKRDLRYVQVLNRKLQKKNDSFKNKKSSTLSTNLPQNDENFQSSFNEEKKPNKQIAPPQKNKKNNFSIFYSKKYLLLEITSLLLITFILYSGTLDHSFHYPPVEFNDKKTYHRIKTV